MERSPKISSLPPPDVRRYRLHIAYDGTDYFGWQAQPGKPTVQGALEEALHTVTGQAIRLHSSGRTDAGVHAQGQVAHMDMAAWTDLKKFQRSLNALLPPAVCVHKVVAVGSGFHARFDALAKEYRFFIWNAPDLSPFWRLYAVHVYRPLDVVAMKRAAADLVGTHDFAAFSANPNRELDGTVRTLYRLTVRKTGDLVTISAVGNGFLYKMVRSLAGHLIRVGTGAVPVAETAVILASKTRTARVETAPPHGLSLWKVYYRANRRFTNAMECGRV